MSDVYGIDDLPDCRTVWFCPRPVTDVFYVIREEWLYGGFGSKPQHNIFEISDKPVRRSAPAVRHIGRSFGGHSLEDDCPCPQEPCGLVQSGANAAGCPEHDVMSAKTIRQSHSPEGCPGAPHA